jgi:hypothetical protein
MMRPSARSTQRATSNPSKPGPAEEHEYDDGKHCKRDEKNCLSRRDKNGGVIRPEL